MNWVKLVADKKWNLNFIFSLFRQTSVTRLGDFSPKVA